MNALIISNRKSFCSTVSKLIEKNGKNKAFSAYSITEAKKILMTSEVSVIIINAPLSDGIGLDFAIDCADKKFYAVLIVTKDEFFTQIKEKTSPYGIFTLSEKTNEKTLQQSLIVVISTAKKLCKMKSGNDEQKTKARDLKLVSRAKMILISSFGMDEEQAHKYIERRAMEMRKTKNEIALSIINSYG